MSENIDLLDVSVKETKGRLFTLPIVNGYEYIIQMINKKHSIVKIKPKGKGIKKTKKVSIPIVLKAFSLVSEKEMKTAIEINPSLKSKYVSTENLSVDTQYRLLLTINQYDGVFKPFIISKNIGYNEMFKIKRVGMNFSTKYIFTSQFNDINNEIKPKSIKDKK